MRIRAIIVDDDSYAIESLKYLMQQMPELEITGVFTNPHESIAFIKNEKPDLVFLDIRMPEMTGFDLLDQIDYESLEVIFVTGYNQYAINALRYSALDYLLKPVTLRDLSESIQRYHQRTESLKIKSRLLNLKNNLKLKEEEFDLVLLTKSEGEKKFKAADIIRCEADSNYTVIYAAPDKRFTASKTLGDLEDMLASDQFVRIHKSHLVNKKFIRSLNRQLEMTLSDDTILPVSKRRIQEVKKLIQQ